jgi:hypothetical protein
MLIILGDVDSRLDIGLHFIEVLIATGKIRRFIAKFLTALRTEAVIFFALRDVSVETALTDLRFSGAVDNNVTHLILLIK